MEGWRTPVERPMFPNPLARPRRLLSIGLLLLLGLVSSACGVGAEYGVSAKSPLGTKAAIVEGLTGAKFVKSKDIAAGAYDSLVERMPEAAFAKGLSGIEFDDGQQKVIVLCDTAGKAKVVLAQLRTGSRAFSTVGKALESFAARLWLATAKKEPAFEEKYEDARTTAQFLIATFGSAKRGGSWKKVSASGDLAHLNMISDQVAFWAQ